MDEYLITVKLSTGANLLFKGEFENPCKAIRQTLFQLTEHQDNFVTGVKVTQIYDDIKEI